MASIFTKIIKGELPSYKIAEDDKCYAFLDISPLAEGHTLIVPKQELDYIFDIDDDLYTHLHLFAKKVAKAIKQVIPCESRYGSDRSRCQTCTYTSCPFESGRRFELCKGKTLSSCRTDEGNSRTDCRKGGIINSHRFRGNGFSLK